MKISEALRLTKLLPSQICSKRLWGISRYIGTHSSSSDRGGIKDCNRRGNENFLIALPREWIQEDSPTVGCVTVRTSLLFGCLQRVFFDYLYPMPILLETRWSEEQ
ncbi:hypothetical protein AVEN_2850-1 [Araneus ventricosus]|uniref:Uncharacterized protein n=1 Tax=Araneus ventricosus TaxID=182803 RepID=A0A4Y2DST8_ARAVE|nr:hypothetical protein AVEN_2850-1 [Araneus ventricosus]